MATAGNGQPRFQVHLSGKIAQTVRLLPEQAMQEGRAPAFVIAFRSMTQRLLNSPMDFGEPLYHLPALKLQVRHALIGPLVVYFAVHQHRPLVFLKELTLLPPEES
jgi:hypothetical protein